MVLLFLCENKLKKKLQYNVIFPSYTQMPTLVTVLDSFEGLCGCLPTLIALRKDLIYDIYEWMNEWVDLFVHVLDFFPNMIWDSMWLI